MSAMGSIQMPPKLAFLMPDEMTAAGLRLIKAFFKLRSRLHREELIALAERLVEQEAKSPSESDD
jgi:hypothetical protein